MGEHLAAETKIGTSTRPGVPVDINDVERWRSLLITVTFKQTHRPELSWALNKTRATF